MRRMGIALALTGTVLAMVSCARSTERPSPTPASSAQSVSHAIGISALRNLTYVLTDPAVRRSLAAEGKPFSVSLRDGQAVFPVSRPPFRSVTLVLDAIAYGDVTGDGREDAVTVLKIGEDQSAVLEVAVVSLEEGIPRHLASYSLGVATLKWLAVEQGRVKVNFVHRLPGDPGPRNTEYTFSVTVPSGSGATSSHEPFPAGIRP